MITAEQLQERLVEPTAHRAARRIALHVDRASLIVENRHHIAGLRPHADREHPHTRTCQLVDSGFGSLFEILAVSPDHDGLLLPASLRHHAARHAERLGDVGSW